MSYFTRRSEFRTSTNGHQGQERSAVTHPRSSHARCCFISISYDNRCTRFTTLLAGCFSFVDISAGLPKPALMAGGTRILGGGVGKTRKYNKATHQLNGRRNSAITLSTRPLDFDLYLRMGRVSSGNTPNQNSHGLLLRDQNTVYAIG
ncbi:hypothetical protein J6590_096955, partial [Homalodisca vitripennis]